MNDPYNEDPQVSQTTNNNVGARGRNGVVNSYFSGIEGMTEGTQQSVINDNWSQKAPQDSGKTSVTGKDQPIKFKVAGNIQVQNPVVDVSRGSRLRGSSSKLLASDNQTDQK
jgi:hypothetical protein